MIKNAINQLEIRVIESTDKVVKFDFFIDNLELDKMLNIDRLSDMRFCDFDLDIFKVDDQKFPNYNRLDSVKSTVDVFLGNTKPTNQFLTDRIVLYRCHCGCDYCGVISFKIDFDQTYIYWSEIRFELDDESQTDEVKSIERLWFDKIQYVEEFKNFRNRYCV